MLGVEALPHNVAAARQAAAHAAARQAAARPGQPVCTARFVVEGLRTDASAPRSVAALLTTAWPEIDGGGGGGGGGASQGEGQAEAEAEGKGEAEGESVLVCALHACGDLTPTLTRCVAALASCRALVAVPWGHNLTLTPMRTPILSLTLTLTPTPTLTSTPTPTPTPTPTRCPAATTCSVCLGSRIGPRSRESARLHPPPPPPPPLTPTLMPGGTRTGWHRRGRRRCLNLA